MDQDLSEVREYYREAFEALDRKRPAPEIEVRFYPYIGINHTIRAREGRIFVRIAELCRGMPLTAHRGLAFILVAKLLRKKVPEPARDAYASFIRTTEVREMAVERKRQHGRKIVSSSKGEIYDLDEIFDRLNNSYFDGSLSKPVLTWSARRTYRILGHHDSTHQTVVISRSLDDAKVPAYVVDYVLFHEMLHIHHPTVHHNGRRYNHTAAFRRDERRFSHYEAAERWIGRNVSNLKRAVRRAKRRQ